MKLIKKLCISFVTILSGILLSVGITACSCIPRESITKLEILNGDVVISNTKAKEGEQVVLTHVADEGYEFVSYIVKTESGEIITVTNNTFIMPDEDVKVGANFRLIACTITKLAISNGDVEISNMYAKEGDQVFLVHSSDEGYEFVSFIVETESGVPVSVTNGIFTMPEENVKVGANFKLIDYTISANSTSGGTVSVKSTANFDEIVSITSNPDTDYALISVDVRDASNNLITVSGNTFVMPKSNVTISAVFEKLGTITILAAEHGSGTASVTKALSGTVVTLQNTANEGYKLKSYTVKDAQQNQIPVENDSFVMPESDVTVSLEFELIYSYTKGLSFAYVDDTVGYYKVSGYNYNYDGDRVVIPQKYLGPQGFLDVRVIDEEAFYYETTIRYVNIPSTIEVISEGAFKGCSELINVVFASNSNLHTIESYAFYGCRNLKTINFEDCNNLSTIGTEIFPEGNSWTMDNIYIPKALNTFFDNGSFKYFSVHPENSTFKVMDGILYSKDEKTLVRYPAPASPSSPTTLQVNNSVEVIGSSAFYKSEIQQIVFAEGSNLKTIGERAFEKSSLMQITFAQDSTLKSIGDYAFYDSRIAQISIPKDVETIGRYAFAFSGIYTINLQSVSFLGNKIKVIPYGCFEGCETLKTIELPNSVETIESYAFSSKVGSITSLAITSIKLSSSLKTIKTDAFYDISISEINIPAVTEIEEGAFKMCSIGNMVFGADCLLETLTVGGCSYIANISLPKNLRYGLDAFIEKYGKNIDKIQLAEDSTYYACDEYGVLTDSEVTTLLYCNNKDIQTYEVPATITKIGAMAFYKCESLTTVTMSNLVTQIGEEAFYQSGLESITLSSELVKIGKNAFAYCTKLNNVTLPEKLTTIEYSAFYSCKGLKNINIPKNVAIIDTSAFANTGLETLTFDNAQSQVSLEIASGAFANTKLTTVTLVSRIKKVGQAIFKDCTQLTSVTVSNNTDNWKYCKMGTDNSHYIIDLSSPTDNVTKFKDENIRYIINESLA